MMTFGRQAQLASFLLDKKQEALKALDVGKKYLTGTSSLTLPKDQTSFHRQAYLTAIYSRFEGYLLDVAGEMLMCFPEKLKNSDMKLHDFIEQPADFLTMTVDKQTDSLGYKRFEVITKTVMQYFSSKPFSSASQPIVQELKATRDIYVHNGGRWNTIYANKAGPNARQGVHGMLHLDETYLTAGTDALIAFINDFHNAGPRQYQRYTPEFAFQRMWEATALERIIPFAKAWSVDSAEHIVRPKEEALEWAWSGSEKYLYDFFLTIYSPDYPAITSKLQKAFDRWPVETPSGLVMQSWFRSPFYF